jgi:hypothetical protein
MSIFDTTLFIPAEVSLLGARAERERVVLPLVARHSWGFVAAALAVGFVAIACLVMGLGFLAASAAAGANRVFAPVFLLAAILPGAVAYTALRDLRVRQPVLVVDRDGIVDRRLGPDTIGWEQIVGAEFVAAANGINAVRLVLEADGEPRFDPLRIGGWSAEWRRRRRVRLVALLLLDKRAHTLAHTIVMLAGRGRPALSDPSSSPGARG